MTWNDGGRYEGEWENDTRSGQGKMTYTDGTVKEGQWKDGEFVE